ncbi:hypothetical protein CY34DRAFT_9656 [Suillus luteus UH-Slu-Lm8-n1]|uniref:Uncharacterized protein n=1 Tax=Suillus luteus UH-Slu-Lm8-n1 TaxID=930992 RepID=A0A0D0AXY5_9AGAM|nr:hypothetical protein CY34DRAFT_9656 [Suillus luteus UH-Slu-Lm8-n1]
MTQSLSQTFKLQGHTSINLSLRIELGGNANPKGEGSEVDDDDNRLLAENNEESNEGGEAAHGAGDEESIAKLKERLQLAELGCSRLAELYQKYRLRWLEEHHRVKVLEEYAPDGIDTCSAHQIVWDAPSPIQSDDGDNDEVE